MIKKICSYIKNPKKIINTLIIKRIIKVTNKKYLEVEYEIRLGKKLNLDNPKTFNEKMQWLKLYNRKDIYTKMVDKYEAKEYVANKIGKEYIIPNIGIYNKFREINFDILPNRFVIKCTHDSGGLVICKDKEKLNKKEAEKIINKSLKVNYYKYSKEWPYKNVKPRIIIEKYMATEEQKELIDYKFFCFSGIPKIVLVCSERSKNLKKTFFDTNWNYIDITEGNHQTNKNIKKPVNLEKMKELAEKLSKNIPFIRIDFYEIDDKIYFSEMTFFPNAGFEKFKPEIYDKKLGDLIKLPYNK